MQHIFSSEHGKRKIFQNISSELIDSQCFSKMITKMQKNFSGIFFLLLRALLKKRNVGKVICFMGDHFHFYKSCLSEKFATEYNLNMPLKSNNMASKINQKYFNQKTQTNCRINNSLFLSFFLERWNGNEIPKRNIFALHLLLSIIVTMKT